MRLHTDRRPAPGRWVGEWQLAPGRYWYGADRITITMNAEGTYLVESKSRRPTIFPGNALRAFCEMLVGAQRVG